MNRAVFLIASQIFFQCLSWSCSPQVLSGTDLVTGSKVSIDPKNNSKGTVVLFLSARCPCSKSHEKGLEALAEEFPKVKFVGIHSNSDEAVEMAKDHFKSAGFSFPIIQDENLKIANEFRALKTPHAFVVGPKGECWFNGGVDDSNDSSQATRHYLRAALNDLSQGKEPSEKKVRTLGCVIRR